MSVLFYHKKKNFLLAYKNNTLIFCNLYPLTTVIGLVFIKYSRTKYRKKTIKHNYNYV